MGLILDTSILIAAERRGDAVEDILHRAKVAHGEFDLALSSISAIELTHGIARARTVAQSERRRAFAAEIFHDLVVHPVSLAIAQLPDRRQRSRCFTASPAPPSAQK